MGIYADAVQKLYVAYFSRPGDVAGLTYWESVVTAAGGNTAAVSAAFAASQEYKDTFEGQSQYQIVNTIYNNLFGRDAEPAGLTYWGQHLISGAITIDAAVTAIAAGAQGTDLTAYNNKVKAASAFTTGLDTTTEILGYSGKDANIVAKDFLATVTTDASLAAAIVPATLQASIDAVVEAGTPDPEVTVHNLTTGVDKIAGTAANDVINAVVSSDTTVQTLTSLDTINGGAGDDVLSISALTDFAIAPGTTITNIEDVEILAAAKFGTFTANGTGNLDLSTAFANVGELSISKAAEADFKAGSATAVKVTDIVGGVEVVGGASQTVSLAAQGGAAAVSGSAGAVSVTSAAQGNNAITVNGGSTVDVVATTKVSNAAINVGATAAATGAVKVTSNLNSDGTTANLVGNTVGVTGGSTIKVTTNATSVAKDENADFDVTIGAITATGDGKTTSVAIDQVKSATTFTKAAVSAVKETSVVTFGAIKSGETLTINGLSFTAAKDLTAEQAAAAFAGLTKDDIQAATGPVANGVYSGTFNAANWTSAAASGKTVTFTAGDEDEADLAFTGNATTNDAGARIPTQVKAAGTAGTAKDESTNTTSYGAVRVDDAATAAITTVALNGYASADIGVTGNALDKLATLSLANSAGAATVDSAATTLDVTVNNVKHGVDLDSGSATVATLKLNTTGADSAFALTAAAVKELTVAGTNAADLTGSTLTALETVTVSGSAGLNLGASVVAKSVNTTATSGKVTATINGTTATYTGGAGVDTVTTSTTTVTKAVDLGAGDDTLTLATGTTSSTVVLTGGEGTDVLSLAAADAEALSANSTFETKFTGFERIRVASATGGARTVDMSNLNDINYVISAGGAAGSGAVAEVTEVTVTGSTDDAADTVSINVGGTTFTATGLFADATAVAAALATQIDGDAAYVATAAAGKITITAAATNTPFTVGAASATSNGGAADTVGSTAVETVAAAAAVAAGSLALTKFANNGTLELTGAATTTSVALTDATGTADVLNIVAKVSNADLNFGTVAAAGVETINITATDTADDANTATLTLSDAALKSVVVTGNGNLNLALNADVVALTSVDATALTGKLTATTNGTVAQTIKGGSGADMLTAKVSASVADRLEGGAGNDTLIANKGMTVMVGGAGTDTFKIDVASVNVNSAATVSDFLSGDVIDFNGASSFKSAAISLDSTAVFQDFANAAVASITTNNGLAWFQFGGNTYIVMETDNGTNADVFTNNQDFIVKITGTVDLSTASFNTTHGTLEMV